MMTRREFAARCAALPATGIARSASRRPNIVILLADDLGWGDISSFGAPDIRTPHIDGIGRAGVRATSYYCNAPECTPTRTALLTGRYQQRVGGLECAIGVGNVGRYDDAIWLQERGELGLPVTETTFARILQQNGYDTACFGKWHLGYPDKFSPQRHGFDEWLSILGGNADYFTHREEDGKLVLYRNGRPDDEKGYTTDLLADAAIQWLKKRTARPFFLYVPFTAPHTPIQDPDAFDESAGTAPVHKQNRAVYAKMVERMDLRVGDILGQLRASGFADNTIVLFMSDNGGEANGNNGYLRGRKGSLWEGGIRVPFVMRWPGQLPAGETVTDLLMSMDLAPTLLKAAGVAPPSQIRFDGVDMMPVLKRQRAAAPRTVCWRFKRGEVVRKAIRDGNWKLVLDNGTEELHNLAADEREEKNLLLKHPEQVAQLKQKLAQWERDVMAPRLRPFRSQPG